jgi:hypothetical protein
MQEKLLKQQEFQAKVGEQSRSCRKGLCLWEAAKAFRVLFSYYGSKTVVDQRKQRDGTSIEKSCPKAMSITPSSWGGASIKSTSAQHIQNPSLFTKEIEGTRSGLALPFLSWRLP